MAASAAGYDPMSSLSAPMGGRAARLSFDPAQPETYSTFRLKLKALSSSTMADAAEMGKCPTYSMIASRMPDDASEETIAEEAMRLIRQYEAASSELYRAITTAIVTDGSPKGALLLEQIDRSYGVDRDGVSTMQYLDRRYADTTSFDVQEKLRAELDVDRIVEVLRKCTGPDSAEEALLDLLARVWLKIFGNDLKHPMSFIRRVLLAMKGTGGLVAMIAQPHGPNGEVLVGVLDQYVYGDPEAGRAWASMFHEFLVGLGARVTDFDLNLGRIDNSHGWLVYAKYVDELIVAGSTEAIVDWLRDKVVERFPGSTHGPWATVLGFGVAYDRKNRTVSVNAAKLILDACDKFGLEG